MLLLQIEVNKGKMPYLSASIIYSESKMIAIHARGWGGVTPRNLKLDYHVLLLYYEVNFIRETSASGT